MYQAVGIIELKSIAKGVEACDAALKSAGIKLVSAHPSCPGKYEIIVTGAIADVDAAISHVKSRFDGNIIDSSVMGRIDEQVITALFGTEPTEKRGSLRGMGGKGLVMVTGDVGDVTAAVEAGASYAADSGLLSNKSVIAAPHKELWEQI